MPIMKAIICIIANSCIQNLITDRSLAILLNILLVVLSVSFCGLFCSFASSKPFLRIKIKGTAKHTINNITVKTIIK